jgi:hypothetical protein
LGPETETAPPPIPETPETPEAPAPTEGAGITPESKIKDLNLLVENDLIEGKEYLNLGVAQESLGEISKELDKLLNS